jgi:hypothetical protein
MKKIFLMSLFIIAALACNKTKFSPEGPTDVRVRNLTDKIFRQVIVNTSGGIDTLGDINPGASSVYSRFTKAFPRAEISARINGDLYSTATVDYTGMTYLGQSKISYEVIIFDSGRKMLEILNCSLDAPLK